MMCGMSHVMVLKNWNLLFICFFFFKQKTAYEIKECDWSSDVCSSDLQKREERSDEQYDG